VIAFCFCEINKRREEVVWKYEPHNLASRFHERKLLSENRNFLAATQIAKLGKEKKRIKIQ